MPLRFIEFMSRVEFEAMKPSGRVAVISITSPGTQLAWVKHGWLDSLRLQFFDTNPDQTASVHNKIFVMKTPPPMHELHARAILAFVRQVEQRGATGVVVHCEQGVSRSAAVAKWIADTRGLHLDPTKLDYHNTYVYRLLTEASE